VVCDLQVAYSNNQLYIVRTELARNASTTTPNPFSPEFNSIYWARVTPNTLAAPDTSGSLCSANIGMAAKGVIFSGQGLHLAYPSVSVTADGTAYITYSYASNGTLPDFSRAYPGENLVALLRTCLLHHLVGDFNKLGEI
jgi:hypothetical protein